MRYVLLFAVLLVTPAGCERSGTQRDSSQGLANLHPPIILITLDTVRADHLGSYGYFRETSPVFDAFAREAVLFENAYAPMATTLPSHTSLLTAFEPLEHGVLANIDDGGNAFGRKPGARSFAEVAKSAGYATGAFVSATPLKRIGGLATGFDVYDEPEGATRDGGDTIRKALDWLAGQAAERTLLWVHLYDPHFPYTPKPPLDTLFLADDQQPRLDAWIAERTIPEVVQPSQCKGRIPTVTRTAHNLYDAELRYTDELLGRLFEQLRGRGWWGSAVVVVVADHGEGLNQHDWPQHGRVWNEQLRIPLAIKFPKSAGVPAQRFAKLTGLVDVIPTICGRLQLSWTDGFTSAATGRDVLATGFRERPLLGLRSGRKCPDDHGGEFVLTRGEWRFHRGAPGGDMLFHRGEDPHELRNLLTSKPAIAEQASRETAALIEYFTARGKDLDQGAPRPPQKMDEKLRRELADLGYAGGEEEDEPVP
jgi:arylsulfatase